MENKFRTILAVSAIIVGLALLAYFVGAAILLGNSIESWGNYSSTINFTCFNSTGIFAPLNATLLYNASGGSADAIYGTILVIIENTSANQSTFNSDVSIAGLADGKIYNITCMMRNGTDTAYSVAAENVAIDNTIPNSSVIDAPVQGANWSGEIKMNATVEDALTAIASVKFGIRNASADELFNLSATKTSGNIWGANLSTNTTDLPDGRYNISVYTYDHAGNLNSTGLVVPITIDNTIPTVTFSCLPATVYQGDTVTCSCSATDATSGVNASSYIYTASPSTTNTGTYPLTCYATDYSNNTGSKATTYNVEQGGVGSGGGGGDGITTVTTVATLTESQLTAGNTKEISTSQQVKFTVSSVDHYAGVATLTATTATIKISSTPQQKTMSIGDEWKVELTNDTFYDLSVKLNSIASNKANLTIKSIHEETTAPAVTPAAPAEEEETPPAEEKTSKTWIIIVIIAAIIIAMIAFVLYKKKR